MWMHKPVPDGGPALGARVLRALTLAAVALGPLTACQQSAPPPQVIEVPVAMPRCELPSLQAASQFLAEAWAVPDAEYHVGEPLSLQMRVGAVSYMNVFHVSTSCKVTRLLHNQPMAAAQIVDFPLAGSGIEMIVKPPAGDEAFYFIATREKIDVLATADLLGRGDIASLDLSPAEFYTRIGQMTGRINPNDLGMTTLKTVGCRQLGKKGGSSTD